jgi:hypothetical protein
MTITEIYVLLPNNAEWEDMIICIDKEAALSRLQTLNQQYWRIEIFKPKQNSNKKLPIIGEQFEPTYINLKSLE